MSQFMSNLQDQIRRIVDRAALEIVAAIQTQLLGGPSAPAPKRAPAPAAPAAAPKARGRERHDHAKDAAALVAELRKRDGSALSLELKPSLKWSAGRWNAAIKYALAEKMITKKGEKRSTTYSVR